MKKNKSKNKEPEFSNEFLAKLEGPVVFIDPPLETAVSLMTTLGPARLEELGTPRFFHFDDTKAQQLEEVIRDNDWPARTIVFPDLWDIEPCQSLVWFPRRGENRELKLDLVEQSWHALKPGGNLLVCLPTKDLGLTFPMIRKIYGTIHEFPGKVNSFFWTEREGSHPRRRHEIAFSVKLVKTGPYDLISRPGVHCYGAIDEGTRTLCEVIEIEEGNRILDICCGAGVAGIFAANKAGPTGEVVFADGSARVRTVALINAQANNIAKHSAISVEALGNLPDEHFDVILAHPPGFGTGALTERIIEEASRLLGPQGRFYLLTKQPRETAPIVIANFRKADALVHRSYTVLVHNRAMPEGILAEFEDDDFTQ